MNEFCCKNIEEYCTNPKDPLQYDKLLREYYFNLSSFNILTLKYCAWCGNELPSSLRDEIFDILEKEYNIETDISEIRVREDLPKEFKTDEWWKKRGL